MKKLIEFRLDDGGSMLVEVDDEEQERGGLVPAARGDGSKVTEKATVSFQEAMQKVKPAAEVIIKKLRELSDPPDEVEVEFGLKMSAEAGAVVAAAGIEANYTVTLKWTREKKTEKPAG
jgi:hypothetical protein